MAWRRLSPQVEEFSVEFSKGFFASPDWVPAEPPAWQLSLALFPFEGGDNIASLCSPTVPDERGGVYHRKWRISP